MNRIPGKDKICEVFQSAGADCTFQGECGHSDTGYVKTSCAGSGIRKCSIEAE